MNIKIEELNKKLLTISNEISLLYKKQDALQKELQSICPHENKLQLNDIDYQGTFLSIQYCTDCRKTIGL